MVSIFLGDELMAILDAIENDTPYAGTQKTTMKLGVDVLPRFARDTTDRNRTSPFAFTGNKFEFRMLGSSNSIACANMMLNSAVAESLKIYADRLEGAEDFETALHEMIKKTIKDHKRILFNGNGYDESWLKEAEKRGLGRQRETADGVSGGRIDDLAPIQHPEVLPPVDPHAIELGRGASGLQETIGTAESQAIPDENGISGRESDEHGVGPKLLRAEHLAAPEDGIGQSERRDGITVIAVDPPQGGKPEVSLPRR